MASPPPRLPPLDGTLGSIQIALVVATWLFGIETLQTFNYYRDFAKDPKILKALVGGIWLLELGYTIVCWHAMYIITVTFYGQPQHILAPPLSLVFPIFFNALIAIAVQTFFVYRVKVLSGQWLIPILCCVMNLARLGFNMLLFGKLSQRPVFTLLTTEFNWEIVLVSSIGPAVDIIVAFSLIYYLWHRRNTDFKHTNRMVDTIIIWTVETTLLTTLSGAMQLILFLARRHDLSWLVFFLIQGKLFSNSLMASLNGRGRLRAAGNILAFDSSRSAPTGNNTDVVIRMHQISETAYDGTQISHTGKADF
uniref:DUF6534 domain-containing protein n=1 Tax=Mycena albidolilacea TaxID=1033008 RepID=A0AAD7EDC0_9AGAR|nr:hypothetical protein DFH08DRAFT_896900 [Mycena albidolilacea]